MKSAKIFNLTAILSALSLLLITGCASKTVSLKLDFTDQSPAVYKLITETSRNVEFEGPMVNELHTKGGLTATRFEMTFSEQIKRINDKGNALVKITIKELKYSNLIKDNIIADFDSREESHQDSPFAKLIGQNYTIELSANGKVVKVVDTGSAKYAIKGNTPAHKEAAKLIDKQAIEQRHSIPTLIYAGQKQLLEGDSWSSIKSFSFGIMGTKSFEKIHTLKEIEQTDSGKTAVVEMRAIPSSQEAEQLHQQQPTSSFSQIFDNDVQTYSGELRLNLTTGKIDEYFEKLESRWLIADPESEQKDDEEFNLIIMSAGQLHSIEKLD